MKDDVTYDMGIGLNNVICNFVLKNGDVHRLRLPFLGYTLLNDGSDYVIRKESGDILKLHTSWVSKQHEISLKAARDRWNYLTEKGFEVLI